MIFQKKSEDPWDQEPKSVKITSSEEADHSVPQDAEPNEPQDQPPMRCPWCGEDMQWGELRSVRPIWWITEKTGWKERLIGYDPHKSLRVDDEGVLDLYKTAWHCEACHKMVIDTTGMQHPYEVDTNFDKRMQEQEETEETDNGTALF